MQGYCCVFFRKLLGVLASTCATSRLLLQRNTYVTPSLMSRRLSKKLKIGKKYFQRCPERPEGKEHVTKHREAQKRLSELEEVCSL